MLVSIFWQFCQWHNEWMCQLMHKRNISHTHTHIVEFVCSSVVRRLNSIAISSIYCNSLYFSSAFTPFGISIGFYFSYHVSDLVFIRTLIFLWSFETKKCKYYTKNRNLLSFLTFNPIKIVNQLTRHRICEKKINKHWLGMSTSQSSKMKLIKCSNIKSQYDLLR